MFPTHVGIARRLAPDGRRRRHVPYACGDCAPMLGLTQGGGECSLRMWGLRGHSRLPARWLLMFPTHVGIARGFPVALGAAVHVPYACGDCAVAGLRRNDAAECSLRMWGLRESPQRRAAAERMFPTHVGIARARTRMIGHSRNVPYACGDCAKAAQISLLQRLCSLRMWGLRGRGAGRRDCSAMFPTHVGIARNFSAPP